MRRLCRVTPPNSRFVLGQAPLEQALEVQGSFFDFHSLFHGLVGRDVSAIDCLGDSDVLHYHFWHCWIWLFHE